MKPVKLASAVLILIVAAVFINSICISSITRELAREVGEVDTEDTSDAKGEYERLFKKFKRAERFISITVSHDDLTNIEESFAEIIGAADAGIEATVRMIKSRLEDSLEHLGRLSGINLDSII